MSAEGDRGGHLLHTIVISWGQVKASSDSYLVGGHHPLLDLVVQFETFSVK